VEESAPAPAAPAALSELEQTAYDTLLVWATENRQPFRDESLIVESEDGYFATIKFDLSLREYDDDEWKVATLFIACQNVTGNKWLCNQEPLPAVEFRMSGEHRYVVAWVDEGDCRPKNWKTGDSTIITIEFEKRGIFLSKDYGEPEFFAKDASGSNYRYRGDRYPVNLGVSGFTEIRIFSNGSGFEEEVTYDGYRSGEWHCITRAFYLDE
jgi:hypothetical protein